jgi:hypothetical protein
MSEPLIPKRFLFRFSTPCLYRRKLWTAKGTAVDAKYRLVSFTELEDRAAWADVRAAWSDEGMAFSVRVEGKEQGPWCRTTQPDDSDGLRLWIDTRDVHNVHRASRFCHGFLFMPAGGGPRHDRPVAQWMPIHRARAQPQAIRPGSLQVRSQRRVGGYRLDAFIPADALTGFQPEEHPRLGFTYAVIDRELGEQTFTVGSPMPYRDDPSLWGTLELVPSNG